MVYQRTIEAGFEMKHGQKTAKSVRKVSAKSSKVSSRKAAPAQKSAGKKHPAVKAKAHDNGRKGAGKSSGKTAKGPAKAAAKAAPKIPVRKGAPDSKGSRAAAPGIDFTNPAVASAFKRALKKYPLALKRLTD